jgi:hypothetical protein
MLNGVGPVRANALKDAIHQWLKVERSAEDGFSSEDWEVDLGQALVWATVEDPKLYDLPKVRGWGKGIRAKVREQFGLKPGFDLKYFINDRFTGGESEQG